MTMPPDRSGRSISLDGSCTSISVCTRRRKWPVWI